MSATMPDYVNAQYSDAAYRSLQSILDDPTQSFLSSSIRPSHHRRNPKDLDILSASHYPHPFTQPQEPASNQPTRKRKASSSSPFFGGLVFTDPAASDGSSAHTHAQAHTHAHSAEPRPASPQPSPSSATAARPAKKARTNKRHSHGDVDDPSENKRQRGRPRLDTQDETAADRRRTQIRLAQRAYRHRKETTIASLNQKVKDLQTTIDDMNKAFVALHDNLIDAGVLTFHDALQRQLQTASQQFADLSRLSAADVDDHDDAMAVERQEAAGQTPATNKSMSTPSDQADLVPNPITDLVHPASDVDESIEELSLIVSGRGINHEVVFGYGPAQDLDNVGALKTFNSGVSELPYDGFTLERPLKAPVRRDGSYTYSFQETTFARRLHRMCLERAFRHLTNPNIDPEYLHRRFRFTFSVSNKRRILARFQDLLRRKAGESLENWSAPYFHIGGAGLHFPRRDKDGNPTYPPNLLSPSMAPLKAFGPQPMIDVEVPRSEKNIEEMLRNIGFDGEWYDSHDVEEYLKTKGIFLDGQTSFVDVDSAVLSALRPGNPSTTSSSSSGPSPYEGELRTPSPPSLQNFNALTDTYISTDMGDAFGQSALPYDTSLTANYQYDSFKLNQPWPDLGLVPASSSSMALAASAPQGRTTVTIDVEQFLELMIEGAACLGRAPGFRKATVDAALAASILQEGF